VESRRAVDALEREPFLADEREQHGGVLGERVSQPPQSFVDAV